MAGGRVDGLWRCQFKALLRRNYLIKLRYKSVTIWEFIIPLAFIIIIGGINMMVTNSKVIESNFPVEELSSPVIFPGALQSQLIVSPNTSLVNQIADGVCKVFSCNVTSFSTEEDAEAYYQSKAAVSTLGVFFQSDANISSYEMRYPEAFSIPTETTTTNIGECSFKGQGCSPSNYISTGLSTLQSLIDYEIIKMTSANASRAEITAQLMPELRYINLQDGTLRIMFPLYFVYTMAYLCMYLAAAIVDDKHKKRKDHLLMQGMRPSAYWASWAVVSTPQAIVVSVGSVIVLAAFNFFPSVGAYPFFFVTVLVYCVNNILIGICWSSIIQRPEAIVAVLFGTTALGAAGLFNLYYTDYTTNPLNPSSNLAALGGIICLLPPAAMVTTLERMYTLGATYPGGLTTDAFLAGDLPLIVIFAILVFDMFLWLLIALWLDGILPNSLGARMPLCFCFDSKYWKPDPPNPDVSDKYLQNRERANYEDSPNVEPIARTMVGHEAVRLFNLKKHFTQSNGGPCGKSETVNAVNGIDLDIYEGQITALLGHNGAGKTTLINMMSGIMPVSSGGGTMYGYDIVNQVDLQAIRDMMGICPQHDVIVDRLSVKEHLELCAGMKGIFPDEIPDRVKKIIEECDLVDQTETFANKLSGGQKRKLNVGMALIGDPKILFLDEPTAGMDPYSRRNLWNLLKKSRAGRVVLLTTHFMDEADILADRKAIISKGKLQCAGSSLYLKNKYGIGYQLSLVVDDVTRQGEITSLIAGCIEGSTHKRTFGKEINYSLPIHQSPNFAGLFELLDSRKESLSVTSYSISMTTLEEVFLKLGEEAAEHDKSKDSKTVQRNSDEADNVNMIRAETVDPKELKPIEGYNVDRARVKYLISQIFRMLPRIKSLIVTLAFLIVFALVGVILMAVSQPKVQPPSEPVSILLELPKSITREGDGGSAYNTDRIMYNNQTTGSIDTIVNALRTSLPNDISLEEYDGNFVKGMEPSAFGYDVNTIGGQLGYNVRYNHTYLMSLPLAVNLLDTALYKQASNDSQAKILTSLKKWPIQDKPQFEFSASSFSGIFFGLSLVTGASFFAVVIVGDREKGRRSVMRVSNVSVNAYFGSYLLGTMTFVLPILIISAISLLAAQVPSLKSPMAAVLLIINMIIQSVMMPLVSFCWTYAFEREQSAGNISGLGTLFMILFPLPLMILFAIPSTFNAAKIVHHFLCFLVPYYSYPGIYLAFETVYRTHVLGQLYSGVRDIDEIPPAVDYFLPENGVLSALLGGIFWIFLSALFMRIGEVRLGGGSLSDIWKCGKNSISQYNPDAVNADSVEDEDEDVKSERDKVNTMWSHPAQNVVMMANTVRKVFTKRKQKIPKVAVRNVSFHVTNGEVFGLLGPNGAGKTTVINMIIAEHAPTAGKIIVDKVEVHSALTDAYKIIGYCPQSDALWTHATVTEVLIFFGISAGLTPEQAKQVTEYYIKMMKIEEHKDKITDNLSGGTRRKVSLAAALMGWPKLVLLDEPSTGLDPSSKRFLWDTIRESFLGHERAAILTTHYMEEADALCNRIGIMVNGTVECLGTSQHLKNKYGDGFQLEIKLQDSDQSEEAMNKLKSFILSHFPHCLILESFSDRILYAMPTTSITSPSQVFGPIEQNKDELKIEEYSFSQATLEQVFLQFAKMQLDINEDEGNAEKNRRKTLGLIRSNYEPTLTNIGDEAARC